MPSNSSVLATRINSAGYRLKHGIHAITRAVKALGTNRALDRRTTTDKALARWCDDLIADLGGTVSTAQDAIISLAVKTKLILDSIDVWLLQQPALIDKRKRALLPAVRERQALADGSLLGDAWP